MKSAFVTLAGRPSSGKSTLMNRICGHKVSIVSGTPQTTRNLIRGVYTDERGQLVFLDTPGLHISEKKINLELRNVTESAVNDAEIVLYVYDCTKEPGSEEKEILEYLASKKCPVVAALNKTDLADLPEANKREMLEGTGNFIRKSLVKQFRERDVGIACISAKTGDGIDALMDMLFNLSPEGEKYYPDDMYTDQEVSFRISEIIREKAINRTREEIPHSLYVEIADMEMDEEEPGGRLWVRAFLVVENESQKGILVGRGGEKIRAIRMAAKRDIKSVFPWPVTVDLRVKVNRNWRKKGGILSSLIR